MADEPIRITAISPDRAAAALSSAHGRRITVDQTRQVATDANLVRADGTFSLIEYIAYLAAEVGNG